MNDHEPTATSGTLLGNRPRSQIKWQATRWFLRVLVPALVRVVVLLLVGFAAYLWTGLSTLALIRFDHTGLENGIDFSAEPIPIDYAATLFFCFGPVGWIVGLGVFGLALAMALTVYRFRWPLRIIVAAAPSALRIYQAAYVWHIYPWVRQVVLRILLAEMLLAVLAAVLCRPIWRLLLRGSCRDARGCPNRS